MTTTLDANIDETTRQKAEQVLERLGISPDEALGMFYAYLAAEESLPFWPEIPNEETQAAIDAAERGEVFGPCTPEDFLATLERDDE